MKSSGASRSNQSDLERSESVEHLFAEIERRLRALENMRRVAATVVTTTGPTTVTPPQPKVVPPFSIDGLVDGLGESPAFPVFDAFTATSIVATVGAAGGATVDFDVLVNGAVVESLSVSTTGLTTFPVSIPLTVNDLVTVAITSFGSGLLEDLLVVLR